MQITQATDYALRSLIFLAVHMGKGEEAPEKGIGPVNAQDIAQAQKVPLRFLLKIMRKLSQEGLVKSYRGNNGGYVLARPPAEISLLDVIEAVEGKIYINRCLGDEGSCNRDATGFCKVHKSFQEIQGSLIQKLGEYTLPDFMDEKLPAEAL